MTYAPHFDIDRAYGEQGEDTLRAVLGLAAHQIEVKRPRWEPHTVFVEVQHRPRSSDRYLPSGLSVTTAEFWAFVYGKASYIYPVEVLRLAVRRDNRPPTDAGLRGDNPTKGHIFTHRYLGVLAQNWTAENGIEVHL
jgi:hypothetical protein